VVKRYALRHFGSGLRYCTAWFAKAVRDIGGAVAHHSLWHADLCLQTDRLLSWMGLTESGAEPPNACAEALSPCGRFPLLASPRGGIEWSRGSALSRHEGKKKPATGEES